MLRGDTGRGTEMRGESGGKDGRRKRYMRVHVHKDKGGRRQRGERGDFTALAKDLEVLFLVLPTLCKTLRTSLFMAVCLFPSIKTRDNHIFLLHRKVDTY